jgi:putative ABC transport system substrate-binding protein
LTDTKKRKPYDTLVFQVDKVTTRAISRQWSALSLALGVLLFPLCMSAQAQQLRKLPRIGYVAAAFGSSSTMLARTEAFRQGLRELGYAEGENIIIEWRFAEGKVDRLATLVAELIRLKIDIILSGGPEPTRSAKEATGMIPIVMTQDPDPVGSRFVASLARPGANITGLSTLAPELSGKRLELLKEVVPEISRVAVFGTSTYPGNTRALRETEFAAEAFGLKLHYLDVQNRKDIETAFRTARKWRADAVLVLGGVLFNSQRLQLADFAVKNRTPVTYNRGEYVEDGGLMSYGVSFTDLDRRAATYVDKILKGAKPADLPVEQPTKFEMIINLKAAKQIGVTIPSNVLARADRVIK